MTQRQRRKLSAMDDPLASGPSSPPPPPPALAARPERAAVLAQGRRSTGPEVEALFVRLPAHEAESLARAAFELRLHKREIVAALIARHVDASTDAGLASVRAEVERYRRGRE